jgi:hypothetical protein
MSLWNWSLGSAMGCCCTDCCILACVGKKSLFRRVTLLGLCMPGYLLLFVYRRVVFVYQHIESKNTSRLVRETFHGNRSRTSDLRHLPTFNPLMYIRVIFFLNCYHSLVWLSKKEARMHQWAEDA